MIEFMSFCITLALMITFLIEYAIASNLSPFERIILYESPYLVLTPTRLCLCSKNISILGCWIICILFRIVNPIGTIGKLTHFIFTTGRSN